jgi:hypothetical protein
MPPTRSSRERKPAVAEECPEHREPEIREEQHHSIARCHYPETHEEYRGKAHSDT